MIQTWWMTENDWPTSAPRFHLLVIFGSNPFNHSNQFLCMDDWLEIFFDEVATFYVCFSRWHFLASVFEFVLLSSWPFQSWNVGKNDDLESLKWWWLKQGEDIMNCFFRDDHQRNDQWLGLKRSIYLYWFFTSFPLLFNLPLLEIQCKDFFFDYFSSS